MQEIYSVEDVRICMSDSIRKNINDKIMRAAEKGENSCVVKRLDDDIQKELEKLGYKVLNTVVNTVISW